MGKSPGQGDRPQREAPLDAHAGCPHRKHARKTFLMSPDNIPGLMRRSPAFSGALSRNSGIKWVLSATQDLNAPFQSCLCSWVVVKDLGCVCRVQKWEESWSYLTGRMEMLLRPAALSNWKTEYPSSRTGYHTRSERAMRAQTPFLLTQSDTHMGLVCTEVCPLSIVLQPILMSVRREGPLRLLSES